MFEYFSKKLFGAQNSPSAATTGTIAQSASSPGRPIGKLRDSEEQFSKLVSAVRDYGVFILDRDGYILTWNAGAERIKGYRADEIIGQHFSRFYPSEAVSSGWPTHELEVTAKTGRFEDEGWRVRKDGSKFWANVVISALREESGAVRGFLKITRDLTDRKQAEEKLRLSEERFRLIVDRVEDYAIFMLDPQGRVATWNLGAERLKGYKADEIIGQHFTRFYPPEVVESGWPEAELRQAASQGRVEDEGWRVRKDGTTFWASVLITALRDDNGTLKGFAKVTRNLTERKQAEENARRLISEESARKAVEAAAEEIERQREQLQVTLSSIGDAVVVTDACGIITFMNPVAARLTGWELKAAAGQRLEDVFHIISEETLLRASNPVETVIKENRVVELANHTALLAKDGKKIPIEDSAAPIRSKDGSIIGAVLVFRDVTEARRAREASMYLAAIVESSDDAIIGQTLDGHIASWNRGAQRLYGYTPDEAIGKPLSLLMPHDHHDELPGITQKIRRGEAIDHFETQRVRKDGTCVDVSLTISPVRNGDGEVIGASKIARDITARREEDRRKNEFLALLAHELRNPLSSLRNGLQIMRLAPGGSEQGGHAQAMMERQLLHLVRLVDDLLDLSRISQGKLQLRKERITLQDAVKHALEVCEHTVKQRGHELTVTVPDEALFVEADPTRVAQAVCNLVTNAAKYSEPGSHICLSLQRDAADGVIHVKDTGVGIPAEDLPHVFDMFMQVDRSLEKSQGGLGVGLTIVKRLIEMHGGSVEARSEGPGLGSEFIIRLPTAASPAEQPSPARPPLQTTPTTRRRILVVDDNNDAATSLAMILKMLGNEVQIANDGQSGVDAASAFRPDIVLLDIGMPKLNGYDAARSIRTQPWGKSITLVALTGWGQEEDRRRSKEAGFDFHIVKPVEPAALQNILASENAKQSR